MQISDEAARRLAESIVRSIKEVSVSDLRGNSDQLYQAIFSAIKGERTKPAAFTCPKCARESFNPNDIIHRYCGACHEFFP